MQRNFCYLCGGKLASKSEHSWQCQACGQSFYRNGQAAVGILIINEKNELLLAVRGSEPGKGMYDCPGGFVDPGESLEEAVFRELFEETGITKNLVEELQYLASGPNDYPWQSDMVYTCDAMFCARVKKDKLTIHANDDVAALEWIPAQNIDTSNLFTQAIGVALKKLQERN